ncbi:MAG: hypothetical protein ACFFCS_12745 [Candidatus Hodarchaeota archaeon]
MEFREFREPLEETSEEVTKDNKEESEDYSWMRDDNEDKEEKDYSWMLDDDEGDEEEKDYSYLDVCEDGDIMRYEDFYGPKEQDENCGNKGGNEKPLKTSKDARNDSLQEVVEKDIGRELAHPNLKEDYFETIDTKEKAYWLGFLYADGCLPTANNRIRLTSSIKEENHIDGFIQAVGANPNRKIYYEDKYFFIEFSSKQMRNDLVNLGCIPGKSKIIELPLFKKREENLAFLLGYFDGDGQKNTTKIISGSRKFLQDIKEYYNLRNKIITKKSNCIWEGKRIQGSAYSLCLGSKLFNEMMANYEKSMPRKRRQFATRELKAELASEASRSNTGKPKFDMTKEELEKEVWEKTSEQIAQEHGVSGRLITKKCREYGIDKPPRGYWAKKYSETKKKNESRN